MNNTILFVDDEKQILKSIRRLFLDTDFTIYTADGGEEALRLLDETSIDLIVVDMRMPGMDGYELLQRVKLKHPNTIRLILSGYAEEKLITNALQNSLARIYLFKPWENKSLITTIEQALEVEELLSCKRLQDYISFVKESMLLRDVNGEAALTYEQSKNTKTLIEGLIGNRARQQLILDIINSSFWDVKVNSIEEALENLGEFNIRNIIVAERLFDILCNVNPKAKKELVLEHASLSNKITDLMYKRLLNRDLSEMYAVAGLMHNIGFFITSNTQECPDSSWKDSKALPQEFGACALKEYEFTYPVIEAALFNHSPMDSRIINKEIVAVVHIASYYAALLTEGSLENNIDEAVFEYLGLAKKDCERVIAEIESNIAS